MIAILDIDGTLVDTNYQHALAWYRAFREHGHVVPVWRVHRKIGMGGDKLIEALLGEDVEREQGDALRDAEKPHYMGMIGEVVPFDGARGLIEDLKAAGHTVVLASSAKEEEVEHYLDLLDARELADAWTHSGDVEETKPAPDLVESALEKTGGTADDAVMIGDSPYDVEAARNAGVGTMAVLTGGFSEDELREAGAVAVYASMADLRAGLPETPLG